MNSDPLDYSMGDAPTMRGDTFTSKRFRVGDTVLHRYQITGELGQGGMGVVYKCFDQIGGIEVALKALPPELSHDSGEMEEVRENFQLVSKLVHTNIAQIRTLERDAITGDYYLIMELISGMNLRSWRKQHVQGKKIPVEEIIPIARQVASALDYAHSQEIMHRDIKPSNVMITPSGSNRHSMVKVLDFGLAAQIHTSMSRVSQVRFGTSGTGPYMAPEQWRGQYQDAATDQYALAVMIYELLSGRPPFENHDPAILRQAVLNDEVERPDSIPVGQWQVLKRALGKDRKQRFKSCSEFIEALAVGKVKKSGPRGLGIILPLLLVLGLGGAGAYWFLTKSKPESKPVVGAVEQPEQPVPQIEPEPVPEPVVVAVVEPKPIEPVPVEIPKPVEVPVVAKAFSCSFQLKPEGTRFSLSNSATGETFYQGNSPARVDLQAGRYLLQAEKSGYNNLAVMVDISAGKTAFDYALKPQEGELLVKITADAKYGDLKAVKARIRLDGGPWNEVALPYTVKGLAAKNYKVELEADGWKIPAGKNTAQSVQIAGNRTSEVAFQIEPVLSTITLNCSVPGATVWQLGSKNWEKIGETGKPLTFQPLKKHQVEIRAAGYRPAQQEIYLDKAGKDFGSIAVSLKEDQNAVYTPLAGFVEPSDTVTDLGNNWFEVVKYNGNTVVVDLNHGLVWPKVPHALKGNSTKRTWDEANAYCRSLNYAGLSNWRLPKKQDMEALYKNVKLFPKINPTWMWAEEYSGKPGSAWIVELKRGSSKERYKAYAQIFIPVADFPR